MRAVARRSVGEWSRARMSGPTQGTPLHRTRSGVVIGNDVPRDPLVLTTLRRYLPLVGLIAVTGCSQAGHPATSDGSVGTLHSRAVVTGGIAWCDGLGVDHDPQHRYMAGTVTVLKGQIRVSRSPGKNGMTIPTQVIDRETVARNRKYRFELPPGHYVLSAHFPPPRNYAPMRGSR